MSNFADALIKLWPHADSHVPGLIEGMIASAPTVFPKIWTGYGPDDCSRIRSIQ